MLVVAFAEPKKWFNGAFNIVNFNTTRQHCRNSAGTAISSTHF